MSTSHFLTLFLVPLPPGCSLWPLPGSSPDIGLHSVCWDCSSEICLEKFTACLLRFIFIDAMNSAQMRAREWTQGKRAGGIHILYAWKLQYLVAFSELFEGWEDFSGVG